MANTLGNWAHNAKHVDPTIHPYDFVASEQFLIVAAPPRFDLMSADSTIVDPIGVCQAFNFAESREVAPVYEIGSDIPYIVPGRVTDGATFSDVLVKGRNLIKKLFSCYHNDSGEIDWSKVENVVGKETAGKIQNMVKNQAFLPGTNYYYNMRSPILSLPVGIIVIIQSKFNEIVEAFMLEECYITDAGFAATAGTQIVADQVPVRFSRVIPLKVETVQNYKYE